MARILCLETATDVCSVGVSIDGRLCALQETQQVGDHAARITLLIARCLEEAGLTFKDLDALAISSGPGSYTSLRIGWSTAKGLAYSLQLPLVLVDTLQAIAMRAKRLVNYSDAWYAAMIDARRMEVYYALYRADGSQIRGAEALVLTPDAFDVWFDAGQVIVFTGNGASKFQSLTQRTEAVFLPLIASADAFPVLAEQAFMEGVFIDLAYSEPRYLKPPNITKPKAVL